MNVEYVNLSDGTTLVTDENGKINKRNTVGEDILILENKIEKSEDEEKNSIKKIEFIKKAATELKKKLLAIPILMTIAPLAGYGIGSLANGLDIAATAGALLGLISSGLASISIASIFTVSLMELKKYKKEELIALEQIRNIKSDLEKELDLSKKNLNKTNIEITNEPISLKEKSEIEFSKVEKEIEQRTDETLEKKEEQSQKKLVLKR